MSRAKRSSISFVLLLLVRQREVDLRRAGIRAWLGLGIFLAVVPSVFASDWVARDKEFSELILPILTKSCFGCHAGAEADGGLSLAYFKDARAVFKERMIWEKVAQRVEIGDMPPSEAEPLSEVDRKRMVAWIRSTLNDIDCGKTPNPGSVTLRRLNRFEYRNTIKDLFQIDYEPAVGFPGDDVGYGFDNIGDVLTLPPLLMEKYVRAAEEISQRVIKAPEAGPVFESPRKVQLLQADKGGKAEGNRFLFFANGKIEIEEQAPWTGRYQLELEMAGTAAAGQYPKVVIAVDGKKVGEVNVETEAWNKPKKYEIPLRLRTGKRVIELSFVNDKFIQAKDGKPAEDMNLHIFGAMVRGQKATEPIAEGSLPASHRELVRDAVPSATRSPRDAASEVIRKVASRAYRRLVTDEELRRLTDIVVATMDEGETYEAGLQVALAAVLVSPNFLFKIEEAGEKRGEEFPLLSEFELATRLSYFLWSSTPDKELLSAAAKKQLRDPAVLRQQMERMIRDERARDFVRNFAGQWLTLRKLETIVPNENMFPTWNDEIRDLARTETYLFFLSVMRENMNVMRLLDADFTFLNEKLARFYGIPGIEGDRFRKVSLKGQKRMGLLTHASILAVTSNPTRTSPVKRGKWILDNILGTPPPPAPPGVPELEKGELVGTLRQQLEQHRENPACASCHKLMDPMGLALENYNAVGLWRTQDRGSDIDASGELPSGEKVRNPGDLIRVLRDGKSENFLRTLTEKLMVYGIGRGLEYYDRCAIDKILLRATQQDNRFQDLLFEIINSDPFQRKGVREEL